MSIRWMAVQYVGDILRLPVVNEGDMDKPFGSSVLERDVKRIVVNPFSDNPQTFVPELENAKLRELVRNMWLYINAPVNQRNSLKERLAIYDDLADHMHELGIEVDG